MTIVWSNRAIERLAAIHDYIAHDTPQRAGTMLKELFESVEQLRMFPHSGKVVPEYERVEIREVLASNYRILYRISNDRIEIVNVLHQREQL
jgi:addiction module RelE/StbE family toxin